VSDGSITRMLYEESAAVEFRLIAAKTTQCRAASHVGYPLFAAVEICMSLVLNQPTNAIDIKHKNKTIIDYRLRPRCTNTCWS